MTTFRINGQSHQVDVPVDMPLLWVLRDVVGLTGTKFGCGMALCGACTIHLDGQPIRSCVTPVAAAVDKRVTTIEAIGRPPRGKKVQAGLDRPGSRPVRLLPVRPDHVGRRAPGEQSEPQRRRYRCGHVRQHLSLWHVSAHPRRDQAGSAGRLKRLTQGARMVLDDY